MGTAGAACAMGSWLAANEPDVPIAPSPVSARRRSNSARCFGLWIDFRYWSSSGDVIELIVICIEILSIAGHPLSFGALPARRADVIKAADVGKAGRIQNLHRRAWECGADGVGIERAAAAAEND